MEMTMYLTEVDGKYEKKSLMKDYYVWKCRQGYWQWDAEYDEICVMRVWNDEILTLCGKNMLR